MGSLQLGVLPALGSQLLLSCVQAAGLRLMAAVQICKGAAEVCIFNKKMTGVGAYRLALQYSTSFLFLTISLPTCVLGLESVQVLLQQVVALLQRLHRIHQPCSSGKGTIGWHANDDLICEE